MSKSIFLPAWTQSESMDEIDVLRFTDCMDTFLDKVAATFGTIWGASYNEDAPTADPYQLAFHMQRETEQASRFVDEWWAQYRERGKVAPAEQREEVNTEDGRVSKTLPPSNFPPNTLNAETLDLAHEIMKMDDGTRGRAIAMIRAGGKSLDYEQRCELHDLLFSLIDYADSVRGLGTAVREAMDAEENPVERTYGTTIHALGDKAEKAIIEIQAMLEGAGLYYMAKWQDPDYPKKEEGEAE